MDGRCIGLEQIGFEAGDERQSRDGQFVEAAVMSEDEVQRYFAVSKYAMFIATVLQGVTYVGGCPPETTSKPRVPHPSRICEGWDVKRSYRPLPISTPSSELNFPTIMPSVRRDPNHIFNTRQPIGSILRLGQNPPASGLCLPNTPKKP